MHSSIRIAIVLTLSLIWITQLSFSPVFLSVIFAICIGCLWYFMKSTGNHFPKWAIYILTLVALVVTFGSYQSFFTTETSSSIALRQDVKLNRIITSRCVLVSKALAKRKILKTAMPASTPKKL
jgi:predicted PurR-regulated permease PerM